MTFKTALNFYEQLGCNMSVKVYFLHTHVNYFPENMKATIEEQGESFHQDIKTMEKRYQGRWNTNMMAESVAILREGRVGHSPPDFWLAPCCSPSFVLDFTFKFV